MKHKKLDWSIIEIANNNARMLERKEVKKTKKYDYSDEEYLSEEDKRDCIILTIVLVLVIVVSSLMGVWR